ncbi:MAG TPA: sulfatase-like hydrolase/transferase, partial [Pirellulales bacterium]|nr:sulfatase-like hydrolase/transferase [Pirellulales bacterium]
AERATDFIRRHADEPFFLYLPFNACHSPLEAPEKYLDRFPKSLQPARRAFAAVLSAMDDAVGQVLTTLHEKNLDESTLIFFLSDNGGTNTPGSSNKPLRGQKMTTWEGGIHVPFFVQWTGTIPAGVVYDQPVISLDILPTAIAAAGGEVKPDWKLDGVNLLPYLTKKTEGPPHSALFWRLGPQRAVRMGNWKLVQPRDPAVKQPGVKLQDLAVLSKPFLIDLAADPGEEHDLSAEHPDKVAELTKAWEEWNSQLQEPGWLP